jgi:hypothetical protein
MVREITKLILHLNRGYIEYNDVLTVLKRIKYNGFNVLIQEDERASLI